MMDTTLTEAILHFNACWHYVVSVLCCMPFFHSALPLLMYMTCDFSFLFIKPYYALFSYLMLNCPDSHLFSIVLFSFFRSHDVDTFWIIFIIFVRVYLLWSPLCTLQLSRIAFRQEHLILFVLSKSHKKSR